MPSIDAIPRQDPSQPRGSATAPILSQPYFKNSNPPLLPSSSPQPSLTPFCPTPKVSTHTHTHKPAIPLCSKASHIYLTNRSYMKTDFSDPGHPDSPSRVGNIPLSLLHYRAWCPETVFFITTTLIVCQYGDGSTCQIALGDIGNFNSSHAISGYQYMLSIQEKSKHHFIRTLILPWAFAARRRAFSSSPPRPAAR